VDFGMPRRRKTIFQRAPATRPTAETV